MSKKKGLSIEEKRNKMLEIFHETKDVFQLRDIEKIAPKSKGIVLQSVKSVLQEMVDDGLVQSNKIGSSVYYWAFPGKVLNDLKRKLNDAKERDEAADKKLKLLETAIKSAEANQSNLDKIKDIEDEIIIQRKKLQHLEKEIKENNNTDSQLIYKKANDSKKILQAANRWTDNVFSTKTWCKNKFGVEEKDLDKNFGIPEDFDYLEE